MEIQQFNQVNLTNSLSKIMENSDSAMKRIAAAVAYPFALIAEFFANLVLGIANLGTNLGIRALNYLLPEEPEVSVAVQPSVPQDEPLNTISGNVKELSLLSDSDDESEEEAVAPARQPTPPNVTKQQEKKELEHAKKVFEGTFISVKPGRKH